MEHMLGQVDPKRLIGDELLHETGGSVELTVRDYWRWSSSNLLDNAARGVFAEFIVASALGVAGGVRTEWDAYDLRAESGIKVEVKSAAYLQSWAQAEHSTIRGSPFKIKVRQQEHAETLAGEAHRSRRRREITVPEHRATVLSPEVSELRAVALPSTTSAAELPLLSPLGGGHHRGARHLSCRVRCRRRTRHHRHGRRVRGRLDLSQHATCLRWRHATAPRSSLQRTVNGCLACHVPFYVVRGGPLTGHCEHGRGHHAVSDSAHRL